MGQFSRQIQWNVTRSVAVASFFYLAYHGAKACLFPFISLYYRDLGLSATQTGIVSGTKSLIWYFAAPIWMVMAKRIQKTRIILCFALLAAIASNLSITLVPAQDPDIFKNCFKASSLTPGVSDVIDHPPILVNEYNVTTSTTIAPELKVITTAQPTEGNATSIAMQTTASSNIAQRTTTTLSSYQLAVQISPRVAEDLAKNKTEIIDLLKTYDETKNLPLWKQRGIAKRLEASLDIANNINSEDESVQAPTSTIKTSTLELPQTTSASLVDTVSKVVEKLKKVFLRNKAFDPSLTPEEFINTNEDTKSLTIPSKTLLISALEQELSQESIQKRSISNDTNLENFATPTIEKNQTANTSISTTVTFLKNSIVHQVTENASTFLLVMLIVAVGEIFASPVELLSDNSLYELLDELDSLNRYGRQRTWAMVGVLICGISVSLLVYFSPCLININLSRFHIHFYAFACLAGLAFVVAPFYPSYTSRSAHEQMKKIPCMMCPTCSSITCTDCRHTLLIVTVFIVGMSQAAVQDFLLWEVADMSGSSEIIYGSFVSAGALSAMIAAVFGRRLLTAIKPFIVGPVTLYFVAAQLFLFSILFSPWMIVPLQLLNVFGHSLLWTLVSYQTNMTMSTTWNEDSGSIRRVNDIHVFARASQQRALYTAYICTYQGVAFAIGSIVSGIWYDLAGGSLVPVLRGFSFLIAVWASMYLFYQCCCLPRRLHNKYSKLVADSDEDEEEIFDASIGKKSWYTRTRPSQQKHGHNNNRKKGNSGLRIKKPKSKRHKSYKQEYSPTSSEDENDEHDWLAVAMKKEDSRML